MMSGRRLAARPLVEQPPVVAIALLALGNLPCAGCGLTGPREASPAAAVRSFEPYRTLMIGAEDVETFLRRRTATLIGGPATIVVESPDRRLTGRTTFRAGDQAVDGESLESAALGAAVALSADGYFLTAAHCLTRGQVHLAIEARGEVEYSVARVVWSDGERDASLLHSDLRPEAWFNLLPDRALAAGEVILAFSHFAGPAAGSLEVPVEISAFGDYVTVAVPHNTPLRRGHSGGPAAMLDGRLLGVQTATGMDTIFLRRSWLVRVRPEELKRLMDEDRGSSHAAAQQQQGADGASRCR